MSNSSPILLALRSTGAVTAIGNSSLQTCASWLTKVRRQRKIHLDEYKDPFTVADCYSVTEGLSGTVRLAAMLGSTVAEACDALAIAPAMLPAQSIQTTKHQKYGQTRTLNQEQLDTQADYLEILLLPNWLPSEDCDSLSAMLTDWLLAYPAWSNNRRERLIVQASTTGGWTALEHAYRAMEKNPYLQHVMIAAVDSACEPAELQHAAKQGWLLQAGNSQGYVAGEAAACVHLTRVQHITEVPAGSFALHRPKLMHTASRLWPSTEQPQAFPLEQVLSGAMQSAHMQGPNISHLESDMDGSDWRAMLESTALGHVIFNQSGGMEQWRPAILLGQCGAASGLINWILPSLLHAQHIAGVNTVLNWAIEPSGEMAACVLERSPH
ncbi:hypothetical protein AAKU61_004470 [Undibacterium sp. GrIS 1.2]|uniref:hypothetical protein n=1 Tax=Undibacterium sp. GrIS 1.2 TaxID=3143933 RepID=UPI0033960922